MRIIVEEVWKTFTENPWKESDVENQGIFHSFINWRNVTSTSAFYCFPQFRFPYYYNNNYFIYKKGSL